MDLSLITTSTGWPPGRSNREAGTFGSLRISDHFWGPLTLSGLKGEALVSKVARLAVDGTRPSRTMGQVGVIALHCPAETALTRAKAPINEIILPILRVIKNDNKTSY